MIEIFFDLLTPSDTHIYRLNINNFPKNKFETTTLPGDPSAIDVRDTKGFVIITPVVSESDPVPISFQYLTGNTTVVSSDIVSNTAIVSFRLNAMGRDAVDLITGEIAPDGTILDGVANGFQLIQPETLLINFSNLAPDLPRVPGDKVDVVGISFKDSYAGGIGGQYIAEPGNIDWNTIVFDYIERPFSCGTLRINCYSNSGLTDNIIAANSFISDFNQQGTELCAGVILPRAPGSLTINGRGKIEIQDVNERENHLALFATTTIFELPGDPGPVVAYGGASWMVATGDRIFPDPPRNFRCPADHPDAIIGTEGDDILNGTPGNDIIIGLGGNDTIRGFGGNDCIDGGDGRDNLFGHAGSDSIFGGPGSDVITGNSGVDVLRGEGGADFISGGPGGDVIRGNVGDDQLDGGPGVDQLDGGDGTDSCSNGEIIINCE